MQISERASHFVSVMLLTAAATEPLEPPEPVTVSHPEAPLQS